MAARTKSRHGKVKNLSLSIVVFLRFLLFFAHRNDITKTRITPDVANLWCQLLLTKYATFLKFWRKTNCWDQELILQNSIFKLLYFVTGFQEFPFLPSHSKTYLDNSHDHLRGEGVGVGCSKAGPEEKGKGEVKLYLRSCFLFLPYLKLNDDCLWVCSFEFPLVEPVSLPMAISSVFNPPFISCLDP